MTIPVNSRIATSIRSDFDTAHLSFRWVVLDLSPFCLLLSTLFHLDVRVRDYTSKGSLFFSSIAYP